MKKDAYSFMAHSERFKTKQQCFNYLMEVRWKGRPECPKCLFKAYCWHIRTRNIFKCPRCKRQFSVIQGTIFECSKIPLDKWFLAIYFFVTNKRGISSIQLSKALGIKQRTAWHMLHRLREALNNHIDAIVLHGEVEADETFVGPKINRDRRLHAAKKKHEAEQEKIHGKTAKKLKKERGYSTQGRKKGETREVLQKRREEKAKTIPLERVPFETGIVVFGMLERATGRLIVRKVGTSRRDINRANIYPLLTRHVSPDATLYTDTLALYKSANTLFRAHITVDHSKGYVINGAHTNGIENAWKHLKKMADGTYCHFSGKHADSYLQEYVYRWNGRNESQKKLFDDFIPLTIGKVLSYEQLVEKGGEQREREAA